MVTASLTNSICLAPGSYGIALHSQAGVWNHGYSNPGTTGVVNPAVTPELTLTAGSATNTFLTAPVFSPRLWNSTITYTCGGTPIRVANSQTSPHRLLRLVHVLWRGHPERLDVARHRHDARASASPARSTRSAVARPTPTRLRAAAPSPRPHGQQRLRQRRHGTRRQPAVPDPVPARQRRRHRQRPRGQRVGLHQPRRSDRHHGAGPGPAGRQPDRTDDGRLLRPQRALVPAVAEHGSDPRRHDHRGSPRHGAEPQPGRDLGRPHPDRLHQASPTRSRSCSSKRPTTSSTAMTRPPPATAAARCPSSSS